MGARSSFPGRSAGLLLGREEGVRRLGEEVGQRAAQLELLPGEARPGGVVVLQVQALAPGVVQRSARV
jgi:hypothetical protein